MSTPPDDVIDHLAHITPGSALDLLRARRPEARLHAQKSYLALFHPDEAQHVTPAERLAVAAFVASLHDAAEATAFYLAALRGEADGVSAEAITTEAERGRRVGPYGAYPPGPLSVEDSTAPLYEVGEVAILGTRLAAAFAHAHLLVFHPRDAGPAALDALRAAGWTADGIVVLSQLVSFLAFQLRMVAGLRALAA